MQSKGLSIVEVASRSGIATSTLSNIINEKSSPSLDTLDKIASAIGVSACSLIVERINGYIFIDDEIHVITCAEDVKDVYEKVKE